MRMYCLCYVIKNNKYTFKRQQSSGKICSKQASKVDFWHPGRKQHWVISLTWCCTVSLLENLSVSTACGQVESLVAGPSALALQTLIFLQELKLGALLQLGSLWQ